MARVAPISSLAPSCRLLCLALVSSASLLAGPATAGIAASVFFAFLLLEGMRAGDILKEASFLLWFAAFTILIQGLDFRGGPRILGEGLRSALGYCARLLAAYLAGRLFYAATTRSELRDAATRIVRFLPGRARSDAGLALSLVLGFMPLIIEEWSSSVEAGRARGLSRKLGFSGYAALISAFLRRLMLSALALPDALAARAWSGGRVVASEAWRPADCFSVALATAFLISAALRIV